MKRTFTVMICVETEGYKTVTLKKVRKEIAARLNGNPPNLNTKTEVTVHEAIRIS